MRKFICAYSASIPVPGGMQVQGNAVFYSSNPGMIKEEEINALKNELGRGMKLRGYAITHHDIMVFSITEIESDK